MTLIATALVLVTMTQEERYILTNALKGFSTWLTKYRELLCRQWREGSLGHHMETKKQRQKMVRNKTQLSYICPIFSNWFPFSKISRAFQNSTPSWRPTLQQMSLLWWYPIKQQLEIKSHYVSLPILFLVSLSRHCLIMERLNHTGASYMFNDSVTSSPPMAFEGIWTLLCIRQGWGLKTRKEMNF